MLLELTKGTECCSTINKAPFPLFCLFTAGDTTVNQAYTHNFHMSYSPHAQHTLHFTHPWSMISLHEIGRLRAAGKLDLHLCGVYEPYMVDALWCKYYHAGADRGVAKMPYWALCQSPSTDAAMSMGDGSCPASWTFHSTVLCTISVALRDTGIPQYPLFPVSSPPPVHLCLHFVHITYCNECILFFYKTSRHTVSCNCFKSFALTNKQGG